MKKKMWIFLIILIPLLGLADGPHTVVVPIFMEDGTAPSGTSG